jgi:hypothetical protein
MLKLVVLAQDGTIKENEISSRCKNINMNLSKKISIKGNGGMNMLGSWNLENEKIEIFGFKTGDKNIENKHELPPPYDDEIFYGDICCCKFDNTGIIKHFRKENYEKFYNANFEGLDELISDEEDNMSDVERLSVNSELMYEEYTDSDE